MKELTKKILAAALVSLVAAIVTYYVTSYLARKREANNYRMLNEDLAKSVNSAATKPDKESGLVAPVDSTLTTKKPCECGNH